MKRCHFYGHRKLPRGRDTFSDIIGNSTCTSTRHCNAQIPSQVHDESTRKKNKITIIDVTLMRRLIAICQAFFRHYPNPYAIHVLSENILYREVGGTNLFSTSTRLHDKQLQTLNFLCISIET
ncbi:hypothetical protein ALC56_12422 [Trachymyrmex septentrionalis]|uniref:PRELI/MSF1 domain-containing protein n=1 Tax=Trachymyrmex septentrionalis TaxID=34720 RepID=A0A195EYH6_9HYME|nr:hypothetical protein ALC56_12422 [Trachymyrmex septentrionalis]